MTPRFLIAGRPNVGKSALFNRLLGHAKAIVADVPGVTRDILYGETEWEGRRFTIIDSGGLLPGSEDPIEKGIESQVARAIRDIAGVILVMDAVAGVTALDRELFAHFKRTGVKSLLVAVNKVDSTNREYGTGEFHRFERFLPVSAMHGRGITELLDWMAGEIPDQALPPEEGTDAGIRFAVVGRPNVGKSSIVNRILGYERVLVDDRPGTTRDSIDTVFTVRERTFTIIDTAGIRRKAREGENVELLAVNAARKALERADIGVVVLSANEPASHQDSAIAGLVEDNRAGIVIALNKWDLIPRSKQGQKSTLDQAIDRFRFVPYAPFVTLSAKTGDGLKDLFSILVRIDAARARRVSTHELNKLFDDMRLSDQQSNDGTWLKVKYMTQLRTHPPTFGIFTHSRARLKDSIERMMRARIRKAFDLEGTPIVLRYKKT